MIATADWNGQNFCHFKHLSSLNLCFCLFSFIYKILSSTSMVWAKGKTCQWKCIPMGPHKIIWQKFIDPPPVILTLVHLCTFLTLFLPFVLRIPLSNEVNTFEMSPNCHLIHSLMLFVISLVISANHLSHLRISFSVFQPKMFAANCSLLSSSSDPNDNPCQTFSEK